MTLRFIGILATADEIVFFLVSLLNSLLLQLMVISEDNSWIARSFLTFKKVRHTSVFDMCPASTRPSWSFIYLLLSIYLVHLRRVLWCWCCGETCAAMHPWIVRGWNSLRGYCNFGSAGSDNGTVPCQHFLEPSSTKSRERVRYSSQVNIDLTYYAVLTSSYT